MSLPSPLQRATTSRAAGLTAVGLLTILVYLRALWNGYAMDDVAVLRNPFLHEAFSFSELLTSPWWFATRTLYRPLTLFTLGIDQYVGHGAPWLSHAINIACHATVAVLVTVLSGRFLPWRAALAAGLLFAVLPVHAEAAASVVGRTELLAGLALVTLLLLVTGDRAPTFPRLLLAVALSAAALASKEVGVAAPLVVLAAAWARPAQRPWMAHWTVAAGTGTLLLLIARYQVIGTLGGDHVHPVFRLLTAGDRAVLAIAALPQAAAMLTLPVRPLIDYTPRLEAALHPGALLVTAGAALAAAALFALIRHLRHPTAVTLGVCLTMMTMVAPAANVFVASGVVLAGRTLYVPSIGATLVVGAGLAWLMDSGLRRLVPYLVGVMVVAGAIVTWREVAVWRDTKAVYAAIDERQPGDYRVAYYRADVAFVQGRLDEALRRYRVAIELFPGDPNLLASAAKAALKANDSTAAQRWLEEALRVDPGAMRARNGLMLMLQARGDSAGARAVMGGER